VIIKLSGSIKTANIYEKTVWFIETLYKGDIVVSDTKQQRSIFHHYKISNFTVIHCQYGSSDYV